MSLSGAVIRCGRLTANAYIIAVPLGIKAIINLDTN